MTKLNRVRISLYDNENWHTTASVLARLVSAGYSNIELVSDPFKLLDIYDYHEDNVPQIIIVDAKFISNKYNGFDALDEIKEYFEDVIIICLNSKESLIATLKSNCDSFIDRAEHDYLDTLESTVDHWAQYVVEKENLNALYASILN